jgi:hypothetical protein
VGACLRGPDDPLLSSQPEHHRRGSRASTDRKPGQVKAADPSRFGRGTVAPQRGGMTCLRDGRWLCVDASAQRTGPNASACGGAVSLLAAHDWRPGTGCHMAAHSFKTTPGPWCHGGEMTTNQVRPKLVLADADADAALQLYTRVLDARQIGRYDVGGSVVFAERSSCSAPASP